MLAFYLLTNNAIDIDSLDNVAEIDRNTKVDDAPPKNYPEGVPRVRGPGTEFGKDSADGIKVDGLARNERFDDFSLEF